MELRFYAFTDDELRELWKGLTMDDGIQYGIGEDNPLYPLAAEMKEEADRRGITGAIWEAVV